MIRFLLFNGRGGLNKKRKGLVGRGRITSSISRPSMDSGLNPLWGFGAADDETSICIRSAAQKEVGYCRPVHKRPTMLGLSWFNHCTWDFSSIFMLCMSTWWYAVLCLFASIAIFVVNGQQTETIMKIRGCRWRDLQLHPKCSTKRDRPLPHCPQEANNVVLVLV